MMKTHITYDTSQIANHVFIDVSTDLLRRGHRIRFRAPGPSMYPTIRDGETITVEPVAPSSIKLGDIVLYRSNNGVIAHRVVRVERDNATLLFILRGDVVGGPDEPVTAQQVLGKVVYVERNGRHIDPYSRRARIFRVAHACASRLKRYFATKRGQTLTIDQTTRHSIDSQ